MKAQETEPDHMFPLVVGQGWVPSTCKMSGMLVFAIMQSEGDPCARCNHPRSECKGRPRTDGEPR